MHKLLLYALSICLLGSTTAQVVVRGKVIDGVSRQPLQFANIQQTGIVKNNSLTDANGRFIIHLKKVQVPSITISYIGYTTAISLIGEQNELTVELAPASIKLQEVVLIAQTALQTFSTLAKIDLEMKPVKNTQELMRIVPGLFVAQHSGGGKAEQIFLRGFDSDHGTDIKVSVDGLPVNLVSHAHGQGYADAHFIIPETVNTVDYGTGPYYAQHGNLNTAGYIEFSTFKNISGSRVQAEVGQYNSYRTLVMLDLIKKNKDRQSAYIAGEFNYSDGATIHPQNFSRFNFFGKYNLAVSPYSNFSGSLSAFKSKWDASGQVPSRAVANGTISRFGSIDPTEGGNTQRYNVNMQLTTSMHGNHTLTNQFYYSKNVFSLYSNFTFFVRDSLNGDQINQAETRDVVGLTTKLNRRNNLGGWTLNSAYGIGVRHDATNNSVLANTVMRGFTNYAKMGDITETNAFMFIQKQFNAGKWHIDGGVRWDYLRFDYKDKLTPVQLPSQAKQIVSPKLNIQYLINQKTQLYVKGGKGFHSNDTRVVVANRGNEILPAAYGADLGFILKPTDKVLINIAAFYLHLKQEFVYVGDEGNIEPAGKTNRQGIDAIVRYQLSKKLVANININFTKPRAAGEPKGKNYIPLAPSFTSMGGLYYKNTTGFNGGINYRFIKDRSANNDNSIVARGYFLLDGTFNYTQPTYEIGIAVENMLNVNWNEAQFATISRLKGEPTPVEELNFTPGLPFFLKARLCVWF